MRNWLFGLSGLLVINPLASYAETVWSNDRWSVDRRDVQNDEDDYKCQLVGATKANPITIFVSAEEGTAALELPNIEGRPPPKREEFQISFAFDGGQPTRTTASFISEFDASYASLSDLSKFLEIFSRSNSLEIIGGGTDRTISLKGSRAAANAFIDCLGLPIRSPSNFVNLEVYYGSRAGMAATVIGESGLDTANAIIRIRHTQENAKAFCTEYLLDKSDACIAKTMDEIKFRSDSVAGNCLSGEFKDMWNNLYRFEGKNLDPDVMAPFRIRNLQDDTILDGSSASGYGTAMGVLKALCPKRTETEGWN